MIDAGMQARARAHNDALIAKGNAEARERLFNVEDPWGNEYWRPANMTQLDFIREWKARKEESDAWANPAAASHGSGADLLLCRQLGMVLVWLVQAGRVLR